MRAEANENKSKNEMKPNQKAKERRVERGVVRRGVKERGERQLLARKKEVKRVSGVLHKAVSIIDAAAEDAVAEAAAVAAVAVVAAAADDVGGDDDDAALLAHLQLPASQAFYVIEPRSSASFVRHFYITPRFCICFSNTACSCLRHCQVASPWRKSCALWRNAQKTNQIFFF